MRTDESSMARSGTPTARMTADATGRDGAPAVRDDFAQARWAAVALLALHAVLAWLGREPGILTRQDDVRYLVLARSLRAGSFQDLMWPGAPLHHMYPPGFPALLAVWTAIGGEGFDWLIILQVALWVATLALTFLAAHRALGPRLATAALLALAANASLLDSAGKVASEGALALCLAVALWASVCLPRGRQQVAIIAVAAICAPLMRSAGIALPAAVVAHWLLERRYRDATIVAVTSGIVVTALLWWTLSDPMTVAGSSYAADLMVSTQSSDPVSVSGRGAAGPVVELLQRLRANALYYPTQGIPSMLGIPTIPGTIVDNLIIAVVVIGLGVGLWRTLVRYRLLALVFLANGALLLVWPYQSPRYLEPLLPVVLCVMLTGIAHVVSRAGERAVNAVLAVATLMLVGSSVPAQSAKLSVRLHCARDRVMPDAACVSADQASFFAASAHVRDSLPPTARTLSAKSEPLYLYSGKLTLPLAPLARRDSATFWRSLRAASVEFVLLGGLQVFELPYLAPHLRARCRDLELVATFPPRTYLFRWPGATGADGAGPSHTPGPASDNEACVAIDRYLTPSAPL